MSRKKHEEHEEHVNHEAWVIPYADMLTLLFCLFLVLWATQRSDSQPEINQKVAAAISDAFSAADLGGSKGILEGLGASPMPNAGAPAPPVVAPPSPAQLSEAVAALKAQNEIAGLVNQERSALYQAQSDMQKYLGLAGVQEQVNFRLESRGLVVSIVSDKVLFGPGSETLRDEAVPLMDAVAAGLRGLPNDLIVEGHTDSRPISSGRFQSNWELSTARATSVLEYLVQRAGVDQRRLSATGYSDTRPVAPNETAAGRDRNRRVEIVVVSGLADPRDAPAPVPTTVVAEAPAGTPAGTPAQTATTPTISQG